MATKEPLFEVPNMDDINSDDREVIMDVLAILFSYCTHKKAAAGKRLAGRIKEAQESEAQAERLYKKLPEEYRW